MTLALELLEAEIATDLPSHLRAFARAYAGNAPIPSAPAALQRRSSLDLARRVVDDPRSVGLLRLLVPIAIESDPTVAGIRSTSPSWPAYAALHAARDAASQRMFGRGHVAQLHWLAGTGKPATAPVDWPAELAGWHAPSSSIPHAFVERAWRDLADRHGARGTCRIVASTARPRAFIVEPGREVIVVIGPLTTPAMRFAAFHELGHALAALLSPVALPRMLDEAAASYVARLLEREGDLDLPWFTPHAAPARARRVAIATALDACERRECIIAAAAVARPPWALWQDPGAQAAYVVAEQVADRWWAELGAAPDPGAFGKRLAEDVAQVERAILADR